MSGKKESEEENGTQKAFRKKLYSRWSEYAKTDRSDSRLQLRTWKLPHASEIKQRKGQIDTRMR